MENFVSKVHSIVFGPGMIAIILCAGVLLTIMNKFFQIRKFPTVCKNTIGSTVKGKKAHKTSSKSAIPQFEAFSAAIAGTIGTGNIVGVATALVAGGPGAIFWMWVSAFFGMMTKFSENVLGIYYRKRNKNGEFVGGPMYYIEAGLGKKWKWLAVLFAFFTIFASFGYNMTQTNSIGAIFETTFKIPTWVTGLIVAVLIALVTIGGIKRIGKVASYIVPFMAVIFMLMGITVICVHYDRILPSIALIFQSAFTPSAAIGGVAGHMVKEAMTFGFSRGIFSNEAGLGSSVMAHSSSDVREPVQQGMWGVFEVFLDTIVICTMMALVYLTSGAFGATDAEGNLVQGVGLALLAFTNGLSGGFATTIQVVFSIMLPLFAFTTILSWSFYGEKAVEYLFGKVGVYIYKAVYVGVVMVGAVTSLTIVWDIADIFNGLMAIPNLISLILLSGNVYAITENYLKRHHKSKKYDVVPMLSYNDVENRLIASSIDNENDTITDELTRELDIIEKEEEYNERKD